MKIRFIHYRCSFIATLPHLSPFNPVALGTGCLKRCHLHTKCGIKAAYLDVTCQIGKRQRRYTALLRSQFSLIQAAGVQSRDFRAWRRRESSYGRNMMLKNDSSRLPSSSSTSPCGVRARPRCIHAAPSDTCSCCEHIGSHALPSGDHAYLSRATPRRGIPAQLDSTTKHTRSPAHTGFKLLI